MNLKIVEKDTLVIVYTLTLSNPNFPFLGHF